MQARKGGKKVGRGWGCAFGALRRRPRSKRPIGEGSGWGRDRAAPWRLVLYAPSVKAAHRATRAMPADAAFQTTHRRFDCWKRDASCRKRRSAPRGDVPCGAPVRRGMPFGGQPYSTPTITSVDFTMTSAAAPSVRPSSSMASLVMEPLIVPPSASFRDTWPFTAPFLTLSTVPAS